MTENKLVEALEAAANVLNDEAERRGENDDTYDFPAHKAASLVNAALSAHKSAQGGEELKPDPNCSHCEGKGWTPAINLDIHGDGKHTCFCVTSQYEEPTPDQMSPDELREEVKQWRTGELYRGYDRIMAFEHEKCKSQPHAEQDGNLTKCPG